MNTPNTHWDIFADSALLQQNSEAIRFAANELKRAMAPYCELDTALKPAERFGAAEGERHILLSLTTTPGLQSILPPDKALPTQAEGYLICSLPDCPAQGAFTLLIAGTDVAGVLYGAVDFAGRDAANLAFLPCYRTRKVMPFTSDLPQVDRTEAPGISARGIWTWGRCIADYRGFLDNMARLRMNTLVVWNDVLPENGKALVAYAHSRCVKVVLGYSWGWGRISPEDMANPETVAVWRKRVLDDWHNIWQPLGGDGIYFQTATEFDEKDAGDNFSQTVVNWVNALSEDILAEDPNLTIEFGLHLTSVKKHLATFSGINPRLTITWEDCGAFPYNYLTRETKNYDETMDAVSRILALRGKQEKAGFVFKGVITLFWPDFKYMEGSFVLGEEAEEAVQAKLKAAQPIVRFEQAGWMQNAALFCQTARLCAEAGTAKGSMTVLCEDGCFERKRWFPCALFAAGMWSPYKEASVLLREVAENAYTDFA